MTSTWDGYVEALEADGAPVLGHLVLYSVYSGRVTPEALARWFTELGLDKALCPGEINATDVYERVTGPAGVRRAYAIDEQQQTEWRRRRDGWKGRKALLMIRHVSRDKDKIVRHLVREVRDEEQTRLSYDARLAVITFVRDCAKGAAVGGGALEITSDREAIGELPADEQTCVEEVLGEVREKFETGRLFVSADKLRAMLRAYIESLHPIRVRPSGGVYFVGRQHAATLAALRELVTRFGDRSNLARVPLPEQDEMRDMVISAFVTRSKEELDKLAAEIRQAQTAGADKAAVQALYNRFAELQAAAAEHEQLLSGSIDDAQASMQLVQLQLASLLARAS